MSVVRVMEPIDIVQDSTFGLAACAPAVAPDQFSLDGLKTVSTLTCPPRRLALPDNGTGPVFTCPTRGPAGPRLFRALIALPFHISFMANSAWKRQEPNRGKTNRSRGQICRATSGRYTAKMKRIICLGAGASSVVPPLAPIHASS